MDAHHGLKDECRPASTCSTPRRNFEQSMTSAVIHDNLNPTWNADFEFISYEPEKEMLRKVG